ncbi:discoidin domain-containing protein, partial [candidate division KSB1 bacterium]|nr:discoidin domain-containing protein [candidate division KSB1 bacterium]
GSREKLRTASSLIWYPAENDVSIRPGWFYHQQEDSRVKTPAKLVDIYYSSVGRNAVLLLNLPPDQRGLIHENDVQALKGMRHLLDETFKINFVENSSVKASNAKRGNSASYIIDQNEKNYWTTDDGIDSAWVEFHLVKEQSFDRAMLQENILVGQRIEKFRLEYWAENQWHELASATTVGYKRLLRFPIITTDKVRLVIEKSRTSPTLAAFGLFKAPPEVKFEPESGSFVDSMQVQLLCGTKNSTIYYTLDGSPVTEKSSIYSEPITLNQTTTITALAISADGKKSLPVSVQYNKARYGILLKSKFDQKYAAGGVLALIDGVQGSYGFDDGRWQGYEGTDLDAVIDLGKVRNLQRISTGFIQNIKSWIFMPNSVKYAVSVDGKDYTFLGEVKNDVSEKEEKPTIKLFEFKTQNISARYVRVIAQNRGICPAWHTGAGNKAWIFADEIVVE